MWRPLVFVVRPALQFLPRSHTYWTYDPIRLACPLGDLGPICWPWFSKAHYECAAFPKARTIWDVPYALLIRSLLFDSRGLPPLSPVRRFEATRTGGEIMQRLNVIRDMNRTQSLCCRVQQNALQLRSFPRVA